MTRFYYLIMEESPVDSGDFVALKMYNNYDRAWRDLHRHPNPERLKLIDVGDENINIDDLKGEMYRPIRFTIKNSKLYAVRADEDLPEV